MSLVYEKWIIESLGGNSEKAGIEAEQMRKLRRVLHRAYSQSVYYKDSFLGLNIDSLHSLADLPRLPFTTGQDVKNNSMRMLCVPLADVERIATIQTSGTTGASKRIYFTQHDLERTVDFFSTGMIDVLNGADNCMIFMSGTTENSIARLLQTGLANAKISAEIHGNIKDVHKAYLSARGFECYVGIPGEMLYLCRTYPNLRPKSVLLSADYIPKSLASSIESTWKCPVFYHYGMTETCYGFAVQCSDREGMHIRSGEFIVEIIDPDSDAQLPPGSDGEIVISTLENEALPLIRYRTGDIGRLEDSPCGCLAKLPSLAVVRGRRDNLKNKINIHMLDELVYAFPTVKNYTASISACGVHLTFDLMESAPMPDLKELSHALGCEVTASEERLGSFLSRGKRQLEFL